MSDEISREEIAALLARESMSEGMTRERAIGVITLHREHWIRLMQGNVCSKQEGEESIAAFDVALAALSAEPCKDAISRKQACDLALNSIDNSITPNDIMRMSRVQPIRPRGHWIECEDEVKVYCSECKEKSDYPTNYCPSCGAEMEEQG